MARDKFLHIWKNKISESIENTPKLRTYNEFKDSWDVEKYLTIDLSRNDRSSIAQLRLGILPLRIETGRFVRETIEQRICIFCTENVIETEYHFIWKCDKYDNIRNVLIQRVKETNFLEMSDIEKTKICMSKYPRQLADYIVKSFNLRKETLMEYV